MSTTIYLIVCNPLDLSCFWFWFLLSLLAFLLGWLLHWLFTGGLRAQIEELTRERDNYHNAATKWESDYNTLKYKFEELQKDNNSVRNRLAGCEADKATLNARLEAAQAAAGDEGEVSARGGLGIADASMDVGAGGTTSDAGTGGSYAGLFEKENLQIIEGIGPKVAQVLKGAGIGNWSDLENASVDRLKQILAAAGSKFSLIKPETWPYQAKLANDSQWNKLIQYQRYTDTGVEKRGSGKTDSKFEKLAFKAMGFKSTNPEDLKVVEGIGPKIEKLLKADGINTWSDLAAAPVSRLEDILKQAGDKFRLAKPDTWPQQAQLAANGQWQELKKLQDELTGGRK